MNHTKGPWKVILNNAYVTSWLIMDNNGNQLAQVANWQNACRNVDGEANAKLMASAPDMELEIASLKATVMQMWVEGKEKPKPLMDGVKCDLFLTVNPWGGSPEILSYIYEIDQWSRYGDDTQVVGYWMDIRHARSALPNA